MGVLSESPGVTIVEVEVHGMVGAGRGETMKRARSRFFPSPLMFIILLAPRQICGDPAAFMWTEHWHVIYNCSGTGILLLPLLALIVYNHMERWRLRASSMRGSGWPTKCSDTLPKFWPELDFSYRQFRRLFKRDATF